MKMIAPAGITGLGTSAVFVRWRADDGALWNVVEAAFEAYNATNIAQYAIAATEIGVTGTYQATDPGAGVAGAFVLIAKAGASLVAADIANRWEFQGDITAAGGAASIVLDGVTSDGAAALASILRGVRGVPTARNATSRTLTLIAGDTRHTNLGNPIPFVLAGMADHPEWGEGWTFKLFCVSNDETVTFDDFEVITGDGDERVVNLHADGDDYPDFPETEQGSYQLAVYSPEGFAVPLGRNTPAYGTLIVLPNLEPAE